MNTTSVSGHGHGCCVLKFIATKSLYCNVYNKPTVRNSLVFFSPLSVSMAFTTWFLLFTKKWFSNIGFIFFFLENTMTLITRFNSSPKWFQLYKLQISTEIKKRKVSLWRDKQRNEVTEYLRKKMETFSTLKKKDDLIVTELLKNVKELRINYT